MAVTESSVLAALQSVVDPNTGKDFVSARCVKNLRIAGDTVDFDLELGYPAASQLTGFCEALAAAAQTLEGAGRVVFGDESGDFIHRRERRPGPLDRHGSSAVFSKHRFDLLIGCEFAPVRSSPQRFDSVLSIVV